MREKLIEILNQAQKMEYLGNVATYIPELSHKNKNRMALALMDTKGNLTVAGEAKESFTLQSMSKIITLTRALMRYGEDFVFSRVGVESVDLPFNTLKSFTIKPNNPMINAGAMVISSLLVEESFETLLDYVRKLAGNPTIRLNEAVYKSEKSTSYRNPAIAYYLKDLNNITTDVEETLEYYYKQCSIELNVCDLANIAAVYANNGIHPVTKEPLIDLRSAEIVKTLMAVCGMYDESGNFLMRVGIPAKSGVSGGILAVVPGRYGIGVYGPGLDENGNSIAGAKMLELLSSEMKLNIFSY